MLKIGKSLLPLNKIEYMEKDTKGSYNILIEFYPVSRNVDDIMSFDYFSYIFDSLRDNTILFDSYLVDKDKGYIYNNIVVKEFAIDVSAGEALKCSIYVDANEAACSKLLSRCRNEHDTLYSYLVPYANIIVDVQSDDDIIIPSENVTRFTLKAVSEDFRTVRYSGSIGTFDILNNPKMDLDETYNINLGLSSSVEVERKFWGINVRDIKLDRSSIAVCEGINKEIYLWEENE
jgi:hypothetical protein